ncbi:MAG: protein-tyrosine-phosphatase [Candidatus Cyclobacteriaceae bacterium M3_2C_046]
MKTALILILTFYMHSFNMTEKSSLKTEVQTYVNQVVKEFDQIPAERQQVLQQIASYVQKQARAEEKSRLTFICTHNSRRSHMSQIWAGVAAFYYNIPRVETYSGGTEATAFNPRAVKAIKQAGLDVQQLNQAQNPTYQIKFADNAPAIKAYSKVYDADGNPSRDFAAIMTCSQADQNCPFIPGATRFAIPYEDPKAFDGTDKETEAYQERCHQIAREMFYLFSLVKL